MKESKMVIRALIMLFGFILLTPEQVYSQAKMEQPQIQAEATSYKFGQIYEVNKEITHIFEFKNVGNTPLKIHKAKTFCNCSTSEILTPEVSPGETGKVKMVLAPDKIKEKGKITRSLTIWTNAPESPEVTFQMVGEILREVDVSPKFLNFGDIKKQPISKDLTVVFASEEPLRVLKIESSSKKVKAKILPGKKTDKLTTYQIQVTIDINEESPDGRLAEYITIFTTSRLAPVIKKLVVANIVAPDNTLANIVKEKIGSFF